MTRRRYAGRRRSVGAVALVALTLAGCGGLSTNGPVQPGLEVGSGAQVDLRVIFPGPGRGATEVEIVQGFLGAGAATGDGAYDTARSYLDTAAAEAWDPDRQITIVRSAGDVVTRLVEPGTVEVTAAVVARVDGAGRYTAASPGATVTGRFRMAQVGGEWRISGLPKDTGRWILRSDQSRLIRPYAVHYVATGQRTLVPDIRWLPLDRLSTRLARAQLRSVPEHLRGAAANAIPEGARLAGDAVTITDGLATVNLASVRLPTDEQVRQNVWAELVATLTQDPEVDEVTIQVEGASLELPRVEGPISDPTEVGFPTPPLVDLAPPVVRRGAEVSLFDAGIASGFDPRPTQSVTTYPQVPVTFSDLAQSARGTELAAVDEDRRGLVRWVGGTEYEVPGFGSDLGDPAYDRRGFLWIGGVGAVNGRPIRLWVVDIAAPANDPERAAATPVQADWLSERRVTSAKVAPDGDLVVVLSTDGAGRAPRLDLAGVIRNEAGQPTALAPPVRLGAALTDPVGLAWLDDTTVATVAQFDGKRQAVVLGIGGAVQGLTEVVPAVAIATTGGERSLHLTTPRGQILTRAGSQWVAAGPGTDLAVAAG